MKNMILNTGAPIPILGFGVFQIPEAAECERCVLDALDVGYRLIDTASAYMNEEAVGKAIQKSNIPRKDLFITTKLWIQSDGYEGTKKAFERSLNRLQLDYLDLYLMHQPYGDVFGAWRAMEELYKQRKIRSIGVANFQADRLMDLKIHNEVVPAINQIETHPFHQQIETQKFLIENNVQIQSWGPFAEGKNNIFTNESLVGIGKNQGKSVAQVILRWLVQREIIAIPKTVNKERMKENFQIFDFELSPLEMNSILELDQKVSSFFDHRDPAMVKWLGERKLEV
ncbi:aldo/keto reductase [Leptospira sp. 201903074]|uniref:aldo/keto reductase n=1 Tax=Leptospira abararensis TaxID=2810036 RepID=UPI0019667D3B|nr:aldo/keto reductase [Leptospira abararensis]MBM9548248.1 aldo/keto reductase [Leptospira abararensis]